MEKDVRYFAYGSCMDEESFRSTVGGRNYEVLGRAILRGYRLARTLWSDKGPGGVAGVSPSPRGPVEGGLYKLPPSALAALDRRGGVFLGRYRRMAVDGVWKGERIRAMTYS